MKKLFFILSVSFLFVSAFANPVELPPEENAATLEASGDIQKKRLFPSYENYKDLGSIIAVQSTENHLWGAIDRSGKYIAPFEYQKIASFSDSTLYAHNSQIFNIKKAGKYGVINNKGEVLLPPMYSTEIALIDSEHFQVCKEETGCGVVDFSGKIILPLIYMELDTRSFHGNQLTFTLSKTGAQFFLNYVSRDTQEYDKIDVINSADEINFFAAYLKDRVYVFDTQGNQRASFSNSVRIDSEINSGNSTFLIISTWTTSEETSLYGLYDLENQKFVLPLEHDYIDFLADTYITVGHEGKTGIMDISSGQYILLPEYQSITRSYEYNGEFYLVEKNGTFSLYDLTKKQFLLNDWYDTVERMQLDYDDQTGVYADYFQVSKNGKYGIVNDMGKIVVPLNFPAANSSEQYISYGTIETLGQDKKKGLYDYKNGKELLPPIYDSVYANDLTNKKGLVEVKIAGKYGIVRTGGDIVIPVEFDNIVIYSSNSPWSDYPITDDEKDGYISACISDVTVYGSESCAYYDLDGRVIRPFEKGYSQWTPSRSRLFFDIYPYGNSSACGYRHKDGTHVTGEIFTFCGEFKNGQAEVSTDEYTGLIDINGNFVEPVKYYAPERDKNNNIAFRENKKVGLKNNRGKVIISPEYDYIGFNIEGDNSTNYYYASQNGIYYIFERDGRKMKKLPFSSESYISARTDGAGTIYSINENGQSYAVDKNGKQIGIKIPNFTKENGKCGARDGSGNIIIPFIYEECYLEGGDRSGFNQVSEYFSFPRLYLTSLDSENPIFDTLLGDGKTVLKNAGILNFSWKKFGKNENFIFSQDGKWGIGKIDGSLLLEAQYDYIGNFPGDINNGTQLRDDFFLVEKKDGEFSQYGILDHRGILIVPIQYDKIRYLGYGNYVSVEQGKKVGVVQIFAGAKKNIVGIEYDDVSDISGKLFTVSKKEESMEVISSAVFDLTGKQVTSWKKNSDNLDLLTFQDKRSSLFGVRNLSGEIIVDPHYVAVFLSGSKSGAHALGITPDGALDFFDENGQLSDLMYQSFNLDDFNFYPDDYSENKRVCHTWRWYSDEYSKGFLDAKNRLLIPPLFPEDTSQYPDDVCRETSMHELDSTILMTEIINPDSENKYGLVHAIEKYGIDFQITTFDMFSRLPLFKIYFDTKEHFQNSEVVSQK